MCESNPAETEGWCCPFIASYGHTSYDSSTSDNVYSIGTQTEMTGDFIDSMISGNLYVTENSMLRSDVEHVFDSYDQSAFVGKDEKFFFFTGLPTFEILLALFKYLSPDLPVKKSLNTFKVLMLTLMRLGLCFYNFPLLCIQCVNSYCSYRIHWCYLLSTALRSAALSKKVAHCGHTAVVLVEMLFNVLIMRCTVLNSIPVISETSLVVFFARCRPIISPFWSTVTYFPRPQDTSSDMVV